MTQLHTDNTAMFNDLMELHQVKYTEEQKAKHPTSCALASYARSACISHLIYLSKDEFPTMNGETKIQMRIKAQRQFKAWLYEHNKITG